MTQEERRARIEALREMYSGTNWLKPGSKACPNDTIECLDEIERLVALLKEGLIYMEDLSKEFASKYNLEWLGGSEKPFEWIEKVKKAIE